MPGRTEPAAGLDTHGTFSTDPHENEKLIAQQRQADATPGRVISHEEYLQKKNMASLLDDMADQAFPETGDMKPEAQAQKHAYKQDIIGRAVEAMRSGSDAKGIFADELAKLPGGAPIDWGQVEEAARRPEAFDPNHLKQTYGNDDLHEVPQSWRYGMREREKNVLAEKIMDHTITPKERESLAELERTLVPRAERRNGLHAMAMDGIEAGPDELDKLGHAAVTGAAYAAPGAAIGTAGGPGGALAGAGHGFRTGAIVGYATKDLSRTAAKVYRELDSHIDENGKKLSENTKQATAAACGLIAAGADLTGLLGVNKALLSGLLRSGEQTMANRLLTTPSVRGKIEKYGPLLIGRLITEGGESFQRHIIKGIKSN